MGGDMIKEILGAILIIFISIFLGIYFHQYIAGTLILSTGLLNIWYATLNKNYNYIFGALFYLLNAYISYINGLYGIALLSLFIYLPLQIDGFIRWREDIPIKSLTKSYHLFIALCIVCSIIGLALLLNMIPNQQLELLDASSNVTNIGGIILMNLKYQEAWYLWLTNNLFDLFIWIIKYFINGPCSCLMLIVSIGYLLLNIYGIWKWKRLKI